MYTITRSDGNVLTIIPDNVIDTTSTPFSLPGRDFAGYGEPIDTNFVRQLENFANVTVPTNPIRGQLWYDISDPANPTMRICPQDGETNPTNWQQILNTGTGGGLVVSGNVDASNINAANLLQGRLGYIYSGDESFSTVTGAFQVVGGVGIGKNVHVGGNAFIAGNITISGNAIATKITTGAAATAGDITGTWTLTAGSTLQATYADLGERYHSDDIYDIGTVVKLGGNNEITMVNENHSVDVLGVISNTAGYIMNSRPDNINDEYHPVVGLIGRLNVKVNGPISKFDRIVSTHNGCAKRFDSSSTTDSIIGWALESNDDENVKLVLCVIK